MDAIIHGLEGGLIEYTFTQIGTDGEPTGATKAIVVVESENSYNQAMEELDKQTSDGEIWAFI